MIGMIGSIATLVWYFYAAEKAGKSPARWAIIGGTIYFMTRYATWAAIGSVMGRSFNSHSANTGVMIELTTIGVALVVVVLVKLTFLGKTS